MREELTAIMGSDKLWAASRAGYMLSVLDQLEQNQITQAQATDWMWDVIRRLDDDADDPLLAGRIRALAQELGQLPL
jgi:hypothetical protein